MNKTSNDLAKELVTAIAELDEDLAVEIADRLLNEISGREILNLALEGLKVVGARYEDGEYFVAGLVMAGEIMRQILQMVSERSPVTVQDDEQAGIVVLGTVEGDIHDLGKDMVKEVLMAHGFEVHDLGVDVAPEVFLAETIRWQPDLVGLSILISSCYPALNRTITQLRTLIPAGFKRPGIMVGGGAMDEAVFSHVKADLWCPDLMALGEVCRDWIADHNGRTKSAPVIL
ncbi:cobalamin-dependent protein [Deltaproteobacteria bacterium OttesenSCG-928-K17]|nr:cobalamin-dependent protein [Deltaproteobacteria bacterium OttesenSCG-928-K17]